MGEYVDGFVLPVPKAHLDDYRELAELSGKVWKEHGALAYVECVADDVQAGEVTSFPQAVQLKDDEVVVFAWIIHASREARDQTNERAMNDPRLAHMTSESMPFDGMRLFWGGFRKLVDL